MSRGKWPNRPKTMRNAVIVSALARGIRAVDIARRYGICRQRVYQIARQWKGKA